MNDTDFSEMPCEAKLAWLEEDVMPVIEGISTETRIARKAMGMDPVDTLTLSNKQVDLAILNARLGERVAKANAIEREAKNIFETTRERHKVRLVQGYDLDGVKTKPVAAGVADSMKLDLVEAEFDLWNRAKFRAEQLKLLRESTSDTIGTIRTKISFEKADLYNG